MAYQVTTVLPSAAQTTSGVSATFASDTDELAVQVIVTDATGTSPTLDVSIDWSLDGTVFTPAQPADNLTQVVAASGAVKQFKVKAPYYRIAYTIGGTTPSITFAVNAFTN